MSALRKISAISSALIGKIRLMMGTVAGIAITYGVYKTILGGQNSYVRQAQSEGPSTVSPTVQKPPFDNKIPDAQPQMEEGIFAKSQPSVTSHDKAHAMFLLIRLKENANRRQVASSVAKLQDYVQQVESPAVACCGNSRIFAGVGFGPEFYQQVKGSAPHAFSNSKHEMMSGGTIGGDILIHAKSNKQHMLQELTRVVLENIPKGSILSQEVTYGEHKDAEVVAKQQSGSESLGVLNYQYSKGELELFPPSAPYQPAKPSLIFVQETGTKDTERKRRHAAVDHETGGSYVLTQKWVHDVKLVDQDGRILMNRWVDKAWEECASQPGERKFKPLDALGADLANKYADQWMGQAYKDCLAMQKKHPDANIICTPGNYMPLVPVRIVRQSVPYKTSGGEFGLYFVSYTSRPKHNELLLDRLIASTCREDKLNSACLEVFRLSHNVHSACWYFPGVDELSALK